MNAPKRDSPEHLRAREWHGWAFSGYSAAQVVAIQQYIRTGQETCRLPYYHHPEGEACMYCCDRCNYDRHLCGGCGASLRHGEYTCKECEAELAPTPAEE